MSKVVLITRPQGDLGLKYLEYWSEFIVTAAKDKRVVVLDLKHQRAKRSELESVVRKKEPDFIILNGHGDYDLVTGQFQEVLIQAQENSSTLSGAIVYAVSCRSAKILGAEAITKGARAYIGYLENFIFCYDESKVFRPLSDLKARMFLEPSNQVAISLLKGNTASAAFTASQKFWARNLQKLLVKQEALDKATLISALYHNFKHQVCLGDLNAKI